MRHYRKDPETLRKLVQRLAQAADDPRISRELRAKVERDLRNMRVLQKEKVDPRSKPGVAKGTTKRRLG